MPSTQRLTCKTARRSSSRSSALPRRSAKRLKRSSDETSAADGEKLLKAKARRQSDQIAQQTKIIAWQQKELTYIKFAAAELQANAILDLLGKWIFEEHEAVNNTLPRRDRCRILAEGLALESEEPGRYSSAYYHLTLSCECYIPHKFPRDVCELVGRLYAKRAAKIGDERLRAQICRSVPFVRNTLFIDRSEHYYSKLIEKLFDGFPRNEYFVKEYI